MGPRRFRFGFSGEAAFARSGAILARAFLAAARTCRSGEFKCLCMDSTASVAFSFPNGIDCLEDQVIVRDDLEKSADCSLATRGNTSDGVDQVVDVPGPLDSDLIEAFLDELLITFLISHQTVYSHEHHVPSRDEVSGSAKP